jgi:hypothetical protein
MTQVTSSEAPCFTNERKNIKCPFYELKSAIAANFRESVKRIYTVKLYCE